jgi:Putative metallopeptidase domain
MSAGDTHARIQRGLRMVTVPFPHLSGLVAAARVSVDARVPTVGVFASGRMVANPAFIARLKDNELVFVLAHEMLHLALRTHERARGSDRIEFNYAHDYIINDMLRVELGFTFIPAGGLDMPGARVKSAEQIVLELRRDAARMPAKTRVFEGESTTLRQLLRARGGKPSDNGDPGEAGDVLDSALEKQLFPNEAEAQAAQTDAVKALAAKALGLAKAMGAMKGMRGFGEDEAQSQSARCAACIGRRGSLRCNAGWNRLRPASARLRGHRGAANPAWTACCRGAAAKAGCSTSCSTPAAR